MAMEKNDKTPYGRSYWVVPGKLLAGFYPGDYHKNAAAAKLDALLDVGIRCIIDLTEEDGDGGKGLLTYSRLFYQCAALKGEDVTWVRVPIPDMDIPSKKTMRLVLDVIDSAIGRDRPVYVHCLGGVGRTGVTVGCYLARHGIALGNAALERIDELRVDDEAKMYLHSPQTVAQCDMVREWEQGE